MRRICWLVLVFSLFLTLGGCGVVDASQGSGQSQTVASTSSQQYPGDGNIEQPPDVQSTPTPEEATATPTPTPTANSAAVAPKKHTLTGFSGSSQEKQLALQLFNLINQDRAAYGLSALTINSTLSSGAREHSVTMSGSCGMQHQCPGEPDPSTRETNEGITWTSSGENIGYTTVNPTFWAGVKNIHENMMAEQPPDDGHRKNLLSSSFTRVGIGLYIDDAGKAWLTEDFAN